MDSLRIILLICGVALLAGIYIWGMAVARRGSRSKRRDDSDAEIENEIELLERVQDSRAARNAGALKEFNEFDIDAEMAQDSAAETPTEREPAGVASEEPAEPPREDEQPGEEKFRPVYAERARESAAGGEASREKTDLVAGLSEIQATLTPDPVIQVDQLDLLREEAEVQRVEAREKGDEAREKSGGKKDPPPEELALAITVMAKEGQRFPGDELRNWFEALKLRHGDMGLFHYRPPGKPLPSMR